MSDAKPPEFKPILSGLASEPKVAREIGQITAPLQAFYTLTQPIYESLVQARKDFVSLSQNPNIPKETTEIKGAEFSAIQQEVQYFDHAERLIRGLPFERMYAITGINKAKGRAKEIISNASSDPDEALAAENNLKLLDSVEMPTPT